MNLLVLHDGNSISYISDVEEFIFGPSTQMYELISMKSL